MTESSLPTVISQCTLPSESRRSFTTISFSASVYISSTISGDIPDDVNREVNANGYATQTFYRVPIARDESGDFIPPPEGCFNLVDFGCGCCKCRYSIVGPDDLFPLTGSSDEGGTLFLNIPLAYGGSDSADGTPVEPVDSDPVASVKFWGYNAPPCKVPDGYRPGTPLLTLISTVPFPALETPHDWSNPEDPEPIMVSAQGNAGAETSTLIPVDGEVWQRVGMPDPSPCDEGQSYYNSVSYSANYTVGDDNEHDINADTTFLVVIASGFPGGGGYDASGITYGGNGGTTAGGLTSGGLETGGLTTGGLEITPVVTGGLDSGTLTTGAITTGGLFTGGFSSGGSDDY